MNTKIELQSYEELFGELDFKKGEEARSVYSPAAYLTDLIQIIEDHFTTLGEEADGGNHRFDLGTRRSDIKTILLNREHTFDQIPYLDIVNDILERMIKGQNPDLDALEILKTDVYPLTLPLNFHYERLKKFMGFLNVREVELQDLFSLTIDLDSRAHHFLGLYREETTDYLLTDRSSDEEAVKAAFNVKDQALNVSTGGGSPNRNQKPPLVDVSQFLLATDLSGQELRELLFQNLS